MVGWTELIDESLRALRLLHDSLLVVLAERPAQLVVVHSRPVLAIAPQSGNAAAVDNLKDAAFALDPVNTAGVQLRLVQELLDELPQMDVGGRGRSGRVAVGPGGWRGFIVVAR